MNPKHFEIAKTGKAAIAKWRAENPDDYHDLSHANLSGADLSRADLSGANLSGANLSYAYLYDANLSGADLSGAYLYDASLRDVDLRNAVMPNGKPWEEYLSVSVPELCVAGGKTLAEVAEHWDCHDWGNCPMHAAFGANSINDVPEKYRDDAGLFIALFDAELIPKPDRRLE